MRTNRLLGIGIRDASATISDVDVKRVRNGGTTGTLNGVQAGVGIEAYNDDGVARSVSVKDSVIEDFQKNATAFVGGNLTVDVEGNTITGAGNTALIAQNGIELFGVTGDGNGTVTGTVKNNTISGISFKRSEQHQRHRHPSPWVGRVGHDGVGQHHHRHERRRDRSLERHLCLRQREPDDLEQHAQGPWRRALSGRRLQQRHRHRRQHPEQRHRRVRGSVGHRAFHHRRQLYQ